MWCKHKLTICSSRVEAQALNSAHSQHVLIRGCEAYAAHADGSLVVVQLQHAGCFQCGWVHNAQAGGPLGGFPFGGAPLLLHLPLLIIQLGALSQHTGHYLVMQTEAFVLLHLPLLIIQLRALPQRAGHCFITIMILIHVPWLARCVCSRSELTRQTVGQVNRNICAAL